MTTWDQSRRTRRSLVAVAAVVGVTALGATAVADDTVADGDGATPVVSNAVNFGSKCVGSTYVDDALVAIRRAEAVPNDGNNHLRVFGNGATVTVSLKSPADDSADITESMSDNSIVLPSDWGTKTLGTMSVDTATVQVTLIPSATGAQSKNVFLRSSGLNSTGSQVINRDTTLKVNWTGISCDTNPPDVTHTIGSPSYTSGPDTYVTSATTLTFTVDETTSGNSGLSSCTVSIDGPAANDAGFTCAEGANNYTLSASAPAGLTAPPDGSYASSASATDSFTNNAGDSFTVVLDNTAPTFGSCTGGPYLLGSGGGSQPVSVTAGDGTGSGVDSGASTLSGTVDTSTVGPQTIGYSATDNVGNNATTSCTYSVVYDFHGFFSPVDNLPTINSVKAGSAVPIKFDLGGNQGLAIFATGYPASVQISCTSSSPIDAIEQTVTAGGSTLSYDATVNAPIGQYVYVWKTSKSWAGTCRRLDVTLADGTTHSANFLLK